MTLPKLCGGCKHRAGPIVWNQKKDTSGPAAFIRTVRTRQWSDILTLYFFTEEYQLFSKKKK